MELAHRFGEAIATEMEEFHVDLWLAPGMNIQRNPLCGRNFEYFSEDPFLSGMMAAAVTEGVQNKGRCGVTIKHFACNNQAQRVYAGREKTVADMEDSLRVFLVRRHACYVVKGIDAVRY